jgi:CRP/FNR family cyclic AMP-dependent transcriptional regulator
MGRGRVGRTGVSEPTIALVDADPDLADLVEPAQLPRARAEARTHVHRLSAGAWNARDAHMAETHHRGFLIADGLLSRNVEVLGRSCVELVGPGDVMRPWSWDDAGSHVQAEVGWIVLEPTRLAVLDDALVRSLMPWPQLGLELFNRGTRRAHHLAVALAIAHHQRVDDRLLLSLWHLAERWGRVHPDGIVLPLPLGHQRLADLVGASRPTVTTALGELSADGRISRRGDGHWVLHGAPPEQLRNHRLVAALS